MLGELMDDGVAVTGLGPNVNTPWAGSWCKHSHSISIPLSPKLILLFHSLSSLAVMLGSRLTVWLFISKLNGDCNFMKLQRGSRVGAAKVFFYSNHPPATQWGSWWGWWYPWARTQLFIKVYIFRRFLFLFTTLALWCYYWKWQWWHWYIKVFLIH